MPKKSKLKKQKYYKKESDDLLGVAKTALKAGIVLGVANTAINLTRTNQ